MRVTHLSLSNFRNYGRLELDFPAGPTLLHGDNAQGKTNLLEALYYLATSRSPHADNDQQLINWHALDPEAPVIVGRLVAQVATDRGERQVEVRLIKEQGRNQNNFKRQALVNRRKVRLMDLLGNLRVVLFLPEDVQIITGSPSKRRRYLDITLCQVDRAYCRALSAYNKVLEERNALLRRIAELGRGMDLLPVYTEKLVAKGSLIFAMRAGFVAALSREAGRLHYEELTNGRETLRMVYLPRLANGKTPRPTTDALNEATELGEWLQKQSGHEAISDRFNQILEQTKNAEIGSGMTLIGPHRDDWIFQVNNRDLSAFGSRGQQRSAILALKLAEIHWITAETGDNPILLLDEVVAELDEERRALLLNVVKDSSQAILTATDPTMFSRAFLGKATSMTVNAGQVSLDNDSG